MSNGVLIFMVAGQRVPIAGAGLEWLAQQGGYDNVDAMLADPDARKHFTVEQVRFAAENSFGRAERRGRM